jgi:NAD(P)-dependent dehydrogenase (short-subunit alcohol dehydrogenase family)
VESPDGRRYGGGMKTILVTGCSSGYGLETARYFHTRGWNVLAAMRTPRTDVLPSSDRIRVVPLDVTTPSSLATLADLGPVDVLVNNAGIGLMGAFEATPMATIREVFETNTFGMIAVAQALIPQMRARRSGVIVNVTSSATIRPFPLVAVYTASKTAIDGFTASLALELAEFGIRAKIVQPGYGPNTAFTKNSGNRMDGLFPEPYAGFAQRIFASVGDRTAFTEATDVAEVVWNAAHDESPALRFPAGPDAVALANA